LSLPPPLLIAWLSLVAHWLMLLLSPLQNNTSKVSGIITRKELVKLTDHGH